ncbi:histidine phosphatase family protein [Pontiellaceae bacterium B1224]|nr:histidine phosphatase family protein [Pontiellaceae bacterium B1224]
MPKTLYLVRHAKSSWVNPSYSDFDRPLNDRGQRDAPETGRRFKAKGVMPDVVLCSPARRAVETLNLLNAELGIPENSIYMQKRIYEASTETLLELIQLLDDSHGSVMLVGHNPSMTWLAEGLVDAQFQNLPTCSVVTISLDSNHWNEAGNCPAELLNLDYPKKEA